MSIPVPGARCASPVLDFKRLAAAEQRDLLLRHAERVEAEIADRRARLGYLREKASMWDARHSGDEAAEAESLHCLVEVVARVDVLG